MTDTTEKEKNTAADDAPDQASSDKKTSEKKSGGKKKKRGTLSLSGSSSGAKGKDTIRQSRSRGRSKVVEVEVRRRRTNRPGQKQSGLPSDVPGNLTMEERKARLKALKKSIQEEKEESKQPAGAEEKQTLSVSKDSLPDEEVDEVEEIEAEEEKAAEAVEQEPEKELTAREKELAELKRIQAEKDAEKEKKEERAEEYRKEQERLRIAEKAAKQAAKKLSQQEEEERRKRRKRREKQRREKKLSVNDALRYSDEDEAPEDMAALRRKRAQKKAQRAGAGGQDEWAEDRVSREVTIPETISVQELSNRMAEKGADVIKKMMEMGVMVTINQTIDADTAELVVEEMGHIPNRVSEADVEQGLEGPEDAEEDLQPRAPVVTVMGHVDHGKTSLLDALRETDVVGGESGGITQHIGAYQVTTSDDRKVTFIDTPGHAAFTEMRARGADITDIVILVIAADDSVMPQTIEAINHAKAAEVPIIVAINKIDLPAADPDKIKQDLLRHEVIVEDMGGQVLATEVSAIKKQGLDALLENVILQSEVLELRANPDRRAHGAVVEAKLEQGRGNVATVLIQTGTLSVGDIFVAGAEWGRVRALIDDHGERIDSAGPSQPVEVLGLNGAPMAGDDFAVVEDEAKAREVSEYRTRKQREREAAIRARGSVEQMLSQIEDTGEAKLPIIIKADVHGSVEAIQGALRQLDEDHPEVDITAIHTGVGGINESDISLAAASNALVVGFNVRANAQARDLAKRDGVDMHYYSIIYNVIDDIKGMLSGMLSPEESENTLGYADVRQVFSVSKVGNVAGCRVTEGVIKRNANARLIRDDVVIHETTIDSLKRGKDDAKEVREGFECGIHLEGFDDVKEGDVIECFEIEEIERTL